MDLCINEPVRRRVDGVEMETPPSRQQVLVLDRQVARGDNSNSELIGRRIRMIIRLPERLEIKGGIIPPLRDEFNGTFHIVRLTFFR